MKRELTDRLLNLIYKLRMDMSRQPNPLWT